jgi:hypothetical protein
MGKRWIKVKDSKGIRGGAVAAISVNSPSKALPL